MIRFDVFGRLLSVQRQGDEWLLFAESGNGVGSRVFDVVIPSDLADSDLEIFLDDIYHEYATPENSRVTRV